MDDFQIKNLIEKGKHTNTYVAKQISTENLVCLKEYIFSSTSFSLERAKREAEILKRLSHPNIVKYITSFENNSSFYLVMEYVDNSTLLKYLLHDNEPVPEKVVLSFFSEMVSVLKYCHNQKIFHRDIKCDNFLLTSDLHIKLCDFGISNHFGDSNPEVKTRAGTLPYMSPETIKGNKSSYPSDIWSLGVVLFTIMDKSLPFFDDNEFEIMNSIISGNIPEVRNTYSENLMNVLYLMLKQDPEERISLIKIQEILFPEELEKEKKIAADYEEGMKSLTIGNLDFAKEKLRLAAEKDHPQAAFILSTIDVEKPIWLQKAADNGNPEACYQLGMMYQKINNKIEAKTYFALAAERNHPVAANIYGEILRDSNPSDNNQSESMHFFKLSASNGNVDGMVNYGNSLLSDTTKDRKEAMKWFKLAATKGSVEGIVCLAQGILNGFLGDLNGQYFTLAFAFFVEAERKGSLNAMNFCGKMLEKGYQNSFPPDLSRAMGYYKMAMEKGHTLSKINFERLQKKGVVPSPVKYITPSRLEELLESPEISEVINGK